jgi:hypothetical protein
MKNLMIGTATLVAMVFLSAQARASDDSGAIFTCAPGIDYMWEGVWTAPNGVQTWNRNGVALAKDELPELHAEYRKVDWELGDIQYRRIFDGGSEGEWHTEILDGIQFSGDTPTVAGYPSVGCQNIVALDCLADATKKKTYTLKALDYAGDTHALWSSIEASQAYFSDIWGSEDNQRYRGMRTPKNTSLSVATRRAIVNSAASIANHDIEYTWADLLENKWTVHWYGYVDQDWDGTVGDIDEIRCDGVAEYAYERNNVRVWGKDDNWDIGHGSDHNLNEHNELWEHSSYDYGELSPVIQAGCGGYGDGGRTTLRDRVVKNRPTLGAVSVTRADATRFNFSMANAYDQESEQVFVSIQVQYNGNWAFVADSTGKFWHNRVWTGGSGTALSFQAVPSEEYLLQDNQRWRVTVIDQGLNASINEFIATPSISVPGSRTNIWWVAPTDGVYEFTLAGIQAGADLDVYAYDVTHANAVVGAGTNGSNTNEVVRFFAQEHTKVLFQILDYAGSSSYNFKQSGLRRAYVQDVDTLHYLDTANGWQENIALPYGGGWAIAWGNFASGGNDVDLQIKDAAGNVVARSEGSGPTEFIDGNYQGYIARVFAYTPGHRSGYRLFRVD